jgi:DNA-binding beta-propeller fold protein YncE
MSVFRRRAAPFESSPRVLSRIHPAVNAGRMSSACFHAGFALVSADECDGQSRALSVRLTPQNLHPGHAERSRRLDPLGIFSLVMCLAPPLSFLEILFRGENCILWMKDFLLEGLFNAGLLTVFFLMPGPPYRLFQFWSALWLIHTALFLKRNIIDRPFGFVATKSLLRKWAVQGLFFFGKVNFLAFVFLAAGVWWALAAMRPLTAALLGLSGLGLYLSGWGVSRRWARHIWAPLTVFAGFLLGFLELTQFQAAREVAADQMSRDAAYDVLVSPDGETYATFAHSPAKKLVGEKWEEIAQTFEPQRMAYDLQSKKIFISNRGSRAGEQQCVLALQSGRQWQVPTAAQQLPLFPVISAAARKLFEIPEVGRIQVIDVDTLRLETIGDWWMFYGGAIDDRRGRLYVTPDIFPGLLRALDVRSYEIIESRWIGWINFDAHVNEETGEIWIARPLANEILVLDLHLRPVARIHVGFQPREVKIDLRHGLVYVGNYMGGTVTVLDLNAKRVLTAVRPRQAAGRVPLMDAVLPLLRGVFVSDNDALYVSERKGIFRIDASRIRAILHR